MSSDCPGKNAWPELVGTNGDYAASVIKSDNSRLSVFVILDGSPVTADFRCDRVRIRVDTNHIVVKTPITG
ncbi:unnamed protein product [Cochlearia groenlandica]